MICPSCQHENRAGAAFCEACGASLQGACANCGNALRPTARFCDTCGSAVGGTPTPAPARDDPAPRDYTPRHLAEKILTSKSALEGERKHVTVLFADVGDYTPLSERSDPEEMHNLMDRCFQQILEQVHHYEGTVNQFTGDGVMALFGAPLALEDAPYRAVRAALAIQSALEPLDREVQSRLGAPFRMRIGIHTGPVVVGRIGDDLRMDYTAVGDTTNLAARLQQAATPGSVLISAASETLVTGFFDLEDLGGIGLKGKSEPVHAFRVRGERAVSGRIEAAREAGLTPLVGRERDLDTLEEAFEHVCSGRGQVVFLVGEAGIGKSRLVHDFRERLTDPPRYWFEGRCASYATNSPFHPVIDALRRAFRIEDRDENAVGKVETGIATLGSDMAWTTPFLRQLLSLPTGDERVDRMQAGERRSETIRALLAIFHRAAELGPLVFVVEDLHWIDAASEEFLTFLADSIGGIRALFLFTHRPGYRHPFGDRSYHLRLSLQPLSEENMHRLVGSLLATQQLPETLAHLIADKSDGNPLFIEELTRSLLDEGVLRVDEGRAKLTQKLRDVSVPDRIQDVLMARIDRLDDGPKRAIQIASVIGREFALRLLERIVEAGEHVQSMVGELRALELIYEKAAHPELAFMFKHALTHDVAYASVLMQRRTALHCIVGIAIEELYRDRLAEHYEALAHHFTLGEDWERALRYHELAGDKAAHAYANQAAVEHYRQALEVADRLGAPGEQRAHLEEKLGGVLHVTSAFTPSGEAFLRAAEAAADGERGARNLARASHSFLWAHDYERSRLAWSGCLRMADAHGARAAEAMALSVQGLQLCVEGRFEDGWQELHFRAAVIAEESGDPEAIVRAFGEAGLTLKHCGESRRSIAILERAVASAEEHGLDSSQAMWMLGLSLGAIGQYGRTVEIFRQAMDQCERTGDIAVQARLQNSLGWCLAEIGLHARASEYNRRSSEIAAEMVKRDLVPGAPELYANAEINLAGNLLGRGDHQEALSHLEPIQEELQAARRTGARKVEARALELRGRALVVMDERDDAASSLREALRVAREIEYPPVHWRTLSLFAELERRSGDRSRSRELSHEARSLIEGLASSLPERELQQSFRTLGEQLEEDPLGAHR